MFKFLKKKEIKKESGHSWKFMYSELTEEHDKLKKIYRCTECSKFKTGYEIPGG